MTRLTPIDTPYAYKLSELALRVSECVEAVSEWCRSVSIDTSVGSVECVQVSIDTGVKVSSRGSNAPLALPVQAGEPGDSSIYPTTVALIASRAQLFLIPSFRPIA